MNKSSSTGDLWISVPRCHSRNILPLNDAPSTTYDGDGDNTSSTRRTQPSQLILLIPPPHISHHIGSSPSYPLHSSPLRRLPPHRAVLAVITMDPTRAPPPAATSIPASIPAPAIAPPASAAAPPYSLKEGKHGREMRVGGWRIESAKRAILNGREIDA